MFAEIAARATTLAERLIGDNLVAVPVDQSSIEQRLRRFQEQVAKGDPALFDEILALHGHEPEAVKRALGPVRLADPTRLPAWIALLQEGLRASEDASAQYRFLIDSEPMPFEQVLAPFVITAAAELRAKAGPTYELLDPKCHSIVERKLLDWVTHVCGPALMLEFSVLRLTNYPGPGTRAADWQGNGSAELHERFVRKMLDGGLSVFFAEYSVLARALTTLMKNWSDALAEFLIRLQADKELLSQTFSGGRDLGSVIDLQAGLSDPHHCARTVLAIKFSSGINIVYKPKSVETEAAYGDLLDWFSQHGLSLALKGPTVLSRAGYGWIGYIDHLACSTEEQLERFYKRGGMLLALYHLLDTTDIHDDNLIAAGEYPMLVDAETLITPPLHILEQKDQDAWAETAAARKLEASIPKSAMLPSWRIDRAGNCHDMSGLGSTGGEEIEVAVWQGTQTDAVNQQVGKAMVRRNRNVPFPKDALAQPSRFIDRIEAGFTEAYRLLMAKRDLLVARDGPLAKLARAPMRLVFRDTRVYFSLLKQSLEPNVTREGVDRSIQLSALNRILCISQPRSRHLPVVTAELLSLEQLDIPAFTLFPETCALNSGRSCIDPEYFSASGYDRVREKAAQLSLADCEEQCEFIRSTFYAKILSQPGAAPVPAEPAFIPGPTPPAEQMEFLEAAVAIGEDLGRRAVRGADGSCTWIALTYAPKFRGYRLTPVGPGLFDGCAGIALFLAGLEKLGLQAPGVPPAQAALMPLRRFLETVLAKNAWRRENTREMEAGLLIYPLLLLGQLLNDSTLADLARSAAKLLTAKVFENDSYLDVHNGSAGVLLGLLALRQFEESNHTGPMEMKAAECLVKRRESGIAGKSLALSRLYAATGDARFQPEAGSAPAPSENWCKGPAGAGLAALAALEFNAPYGGADCLDTIGRQETRQTVDSLYEGVFSSVDLQIESALRWRRPEYLSMARSGAAHAINRARKRGQYRLYSDLPERAYSPGFYQGLSGIGYELLRLCDPEALPSVLMWDLRMPSLCAQSGAGERHSTTGLSNRC